jgi:hypothetical protein
VDFVVFGCGFGALLMLGGFALRDLGPWLFGKSADEDALPEYEEAKTTIRKQTLSTIGNGLSFAGAGIAVVTFAALLASADDKMGAMVVGISVILATVGVAAWSYDTYRRYHAAMNMVYAQERAIRARQTGKPKRARPAQKRDQPAPAVVPQPTFAASEEAALVDSPSRDDLIDENEDDEFDEPLLDWNSTRLITQVDTPSQNDDEDEDIVASDEEIEEDAEPEEVEEPTLSASDEHVLDPLDDPDDDSWPDLAPWHWNRGSADSTPGGGEDALIEESTKSESRVPSWLFDDLDADLAQQGSQNDDPLDQFREAKPIARTSALDKLMSEGDDAPVPADDPKTKKTK